MFKRFLEVFFIWPIILILLILNILLILTAFVWGPIYYIFTGNDPLSEDLMGFNIISFFYNKFNKSL